MSIKIIPRQTKDLKGVLVMDSKSDYKSRKWILTLLVLIISAIGCFLPPIISYIVGGEKVLEILSGASFVTIVSIVLSAYFGFNVLEKKFGFTHVENQSAIEEECAEEEEECAEEEEENQTTDDQTTNENGEA